MTSYLQLPPPSLVSYASIAVLTSINSSGPSPAPSNRCPLTAIRVRRTIPTRPGPVGECRVASFGRRRNGPGETPYVGYARNRGGRSYAGDAGWGRADRDDGPQRPRQPAWDCFFQRQARRR